MTKKRKLSTDEQNLIDYIHQHRHGLERLLIILKTNPDCSQSDVNTAEILFEQGILSAIRSIEKPGVA